MGRQTLADEPRTQQDRGATTATMRWVIAAVGAVVVAGLVWAAWAATAGTPDAATPLPGGSASAAPTTGASPGATPVDGSEVVAPVAGATDAARLPALTAPTPLAAAPLPAEAAEQGGLVAGFPEQVAAPAPSSEVIDSSVTSEGTTMQAALNARTALSGADVTEHYRAAWTALGLAPVAGDAAALAYADRFTSVSLAVRTSGTGTIYTVFATLRTE